MVNIYTKIGATYFAIFLPGLCSYTSEIRKGGDFSGFSLFQNVVCSPYIGVKCIANKIQK